MFYIVVPVLFFTAVGCGNFYFTESDVLRKIQLVDSSAEKVLDVNRNIYSYSEVIIGYPNDEHKTWLVDSCVTFSATVKPKD